MNIHSYPSRLLENAVNEFSKLPGIGPKTALRLVLHLLRQDVSEVSNFGESIIKLRQEIKFCKDCFNISDEDVCEICSNVNRDKTNICVVENIKDVMAIEKTNQFNGVYHVLGGIISPMDGIGPNDLNIESLVQRIGKGDVNEVILALSTTMEGDTTNYYIYKKIEGFDIRTSIIARGVAIGDELEYTDEVTLGRSIVNRTLFENTLQVK